MATIQLNKLIGIKAVSKIHGECLIISVHDSGYIGVKFACSNKKQKSSDCHYKKNSLGIFTSGNDFLTFEEKQQ